MKNFVALITLITATASFAAPVTNTREEDKVVAARVVKLVSLVDKEEIKVSVLVKDNGGSTDLSPTQNVFLTIYTKGEMFSTDATFDLGSIYSFKSAKRISAGVYEILAVGDVGSEENQESYVPVKISVNAANATVQIKAVKCDDEDGSMDCDASTNFSTSIDVVRTKTK